MNEFLTLEQELSETEEYTKLAQILNIKYAANISGKLFCIKSKSDEQISTVCVILKSEDDSFYYPVFGRIQHKVQNLSKNDAGLLLLDYIETYFEEYFQEEEEQVLLPIDWGDFSFEGFNFQLKGQILNLKSEAIADALLKGFNIEEAKEEHSGCSHSHH